MTAQVSRFQTSGFTEAHEAASAFIAEHGWDVHDLQITTTSEGDSTDLVIFLLHPAIS
jgi:hypothetical protein